MASFLDGEFGVIQVMGIREVLKVLGWSQRDLARRLGVHESTVCKWVAGANAPQYATEYLAVVWFAHLILHRDKR
jgi:transcriptional regulator with XRE-family HTH domain